MDISKVHATIQDYLLGDLPRENAVAVTDAWLAARGEYAATISAPWARDWESRIATQRAMLHRGGVDIGECEARLAELGGRDEFVARSIDVAMSHAEISYQEFRRGAEYGLDIELEHRCVSISQICGLERAVLQMIVGEAFTDSWWVGHPGGNWASTAFTLEGPAIWSMVAGPAASEWAQELAEEVEAAVDAEIDRQWKAELDDAFAELRLHLEQVEAGRQARWPVSLRDLVTHGCAV